MKSGLLPPPLGYRKSIPLYYPKTEAEIKADSYERYNPNVIRSARNFYEDDYGKILMEKVTEYLKPESKKIVELGCGSGYLIGNIAAARPQAECVGMDYSYQMLKMGADVFKNESAQLTLQAFQNGMEDLGLRTSNLDNLTYALSDACVTPLADNSVDFCFSCFLWDRVGDAAKLLAEKVRVTRPGGTIVIISPFNYLTAAGWERWHPMGKVLKAMEAKGLQLLTHDEFTLTEPLDVRGNKVVWEVERLVLRKP